MEDIVGFCLFSHQRRSLSGMAVNGLLGYVRIHCKTWRLQDFHAGILSISFLRPPDLKKGRFERQKEGYLDFDRVEYK